MQDVTRAGRTQQNAALPSPRPAKTPAHSPLRWPLCPDRACRRHRECVTTASLCDNKRRPLLRTEAQQDASLARIVRLTENLKTRYAQQWNDAARANEKRV